MKIAIFRNYLGDGRRGGNVLYEMPFVAKLFPTNSKSSKSASVQVMVTVIRSKKLKPVTVVILYSEFQATQSCSVDIGSPESDPQRVQAGNVNF